MGDGETVVAYIEDEIIGRLSPPQDFAGILLEPIQGEGGYVVPPPDFFPALRALCDKYGILLISDEVQSGMGRTGKWWAIENFGVEPDMITSAKGLASGMPLGALITKAEVMSWPRGSHGNTYGGNPIACAASLATIHAIQNGNNVSYTEFASLHVGDVVGAYSVVVDGTNLTLRVIPASANGTIFKVVAQLISM